MQNIVLKNYVDFKKKTFIAYSSAFYKLYPASDYSLWKSEEEYEKIIDLIFDLYLRKYYFKEKTDYDFLKEKNYSENELKLALSLALVADAYGSKYETLKENYKKGLYDLTVIVYIIINVDRDINVTSEVSTLSGILEKLRNYFKYIDQEKIMDKNPFIIDILANKIKDSTRSIKKFFDTIKSNEAYNEFAKYDENSYFVKFKYDNNLLEKYKSVDVSRVYEKYKMDEEFNEVSYEMTYITLLKEYSLGKKVHELILPITANYLKDDKHVKLIEDFFGEQFIKDKIKFSVFYSEYNKNRDVFNILRDLGFKLVLYMDRNEMILDYSNIKLDLSVYAKDKFIENNPKFLSFANQKNIECVVVNQNVYISESELLEKCKEV